MKTGKNIIQKILDYSKRINEILRYDVLINDQETNAIKKTICGKIYLN